MPTDTPQTDRAQSPSHNPPASYVVSANFARELERELNLRREAHGRLCVVLPKSDCVPAHEQVAALVNAIKGIRAKPEGCPACNHGGKIITPGKEHWDDCPYLAADNAVSPFPSAEEEEAFLDSKQPDARS
jgi:hypothetical protein